MGIYEVFNNIFSVGLFYFLEGVISLVVAYKFFKAFQKSKNRITKNFAFLFFFLTITFLLWSLPSLLFPENNLLLNLGSLLGEVFIFLGFTFGMRAFVATRFPQFPQNLVSLGVILVGAFIVSLNASIFGSSYLNPQGVIEWHLHPLAIKIYSTMILILTIALGFEFFRASIINPESRIRPILLGLGSLLAGIGGVLVISNIPWQILLLGHTILFLGIVCIGCAVFFTEKPSV